MKIINNVVISKGSNIKYFDLSSAESVISYTLSVMSASDIRVSFNQNILIGVSGVLLELEIDNIIFLAADIDLDARIINISNGEFTTIRESLSNSGLLEELTQFEITEEQFYDLTQPTE